MASPARLIKAFAKAVLCGTVAGGALPAAFALIIALPTASGVISGKESLLSILYLIIIPIIYVFLIVLFAATFLGLPLTWILHRRGKEDRDTYCFAGALLGSVPFVLLSLWANSGGVFMLAFVGGFSGFVTARVWWAEARQPLYQGGSIPPPVMGEHS